MYLTFDWNLNINLNKILISLMFLIYGVILSEDNLIIEKIHQNLPKPVQGYKHDDWNNWKLQIDAFNEQIWQMMSDEAKMFRETPDIRERLLEIGEELNQFLMTTISLFVKRYKLESKVIDYYYHSLRIVATHQTFELEKPPLFEPLANADGSTLVNWVPKVYEYFKRTTDELHSLKKDREIWPFWALYNECQMTVDHLMPMIGWSATAVDSYFFFLPSKKEAAAKFGKELPDIYTECLILHRYYIDTDWVQLTRMRTLNLIKPNRRRPTRPSKSLKSPRQLKLFRSK